MNDEHTTTESSQSAEQSGSAPEASSTTSSEAHVEAEKVTAERTTGGKFNVMALLSYVGPFVIVAYVTSKDDSTVRFHIKQGFVLLAIEAAVWLLGALAFWPLWHIIKLIHIFTLVLSVIGIVNVVHGHEKELPLIGKYAKYFKV